MQSQYGTLMQLASEDTTEASLSGKVYRKQLAKYQDWVNPDYPWFSDDPIMTLDEEWGNKIIENFNNNTLGSPVPVPFNHTDDVKANTGHVLTLESIPGDGLYGRLQIDDDDAIKAIKKKKIWDVSISFAWDFVRTDDNKHYGPTLCHVALVNTPYLMGMNGFEEVGAALSRLESFRTNNLSLAGSNVIMLSRNTMKELSKMTTLAKIKNDKDFPITVKFKEGDEEKEVVIEPGAEVEVPTEVEEDVTTQIADATEPIADNPATDPADDVDPVDPPAGDPATDEETPAQELARLKAENQELKLSRVYDQLLSEGKVVPAQKDKILGLAKLTQNVELSTPTGTKTDLASVVLDILGSGTKQFSTGESGSSAEDPAKAENKDQDTEGKKPSELLTEEELAGMKAVGADPSKLDEYAEKDPVFKEALATLNRK